MAESATLDFYNRPLRWTTRRILSIWYRFPQKVRLGFKRPCGK